MGFICSLKLEKKSRPYTKFITPWGWGAYQYKTCPQGWLASSDAYSKRFDDILRNTKTMSNVLMTYVSGIRQ